MTSKPVGETPLRVGIYYNVRGYDALTWVGLLDCAVAAYWRKRAQRKVGV